jgi:uncharacterized membrane protein YeaQ/YmgE (transglycosylase-associated protein family)
MGLFHILFWCLFGGLVGWIAKLLYPGATGVSGWHTIALGVAGSFVGGGINWLLGRGPEVVSSSGLLMSTIGAVVCLYVYIHVIQPLLK